MIDENTGETEPTFLFQPYKSNGKKDGAQWQVISDNPEDITLLRDAFDRSMHSKTVLETKAQLESLVKVKQDIEDNPMSRNGAMIVPYSMHRMTDKIRHMGGYASG